MTLTEINAILDADPTDHVARLVLAETARRKGKNWWPGALYLAVHGRYPAKMSDAPYPTDRNWCWLNSAADQIPNHPWPHAVLPIERLEPNWPSFAWTTRFLAEQAAAAFLSVLIREGRLKI